ncbi:hypothetical protein [Nonomuraea sp. NPDC002799]
MAAHRAWTGVLTAAMAVGSLTLTAHPATAETSAAARNLPSCVSYRHTTGAITQTVYLTNNCSYGLGWYVDKEGPNSSCYHASAGASRKYKWGRADAYHGTYRC